MGDRVAFGRGRPSGNTIERLCCWRYCFSFQHVILPDLPTVDKNPYTSGDDIAFGRRLYAGRCAGCHGPNGDGGKGANLAIPSLPRGASDLALYRVIRYGLPETEMPSHNMTQREIWQIAGICADAGTVWGRRGAR